jgi:hypothetical protein
MATQRHFERDRPSALTAVYTVRSTMPTLGTHVGAKLHRAIVRVRRHHFDDHHPCAHGAKGARHSRQPLFRRHVVPFPRKRVAPLIGAHGSYLSTRARSTFRAVVGTRGPYAPKMPPDRRPAQSNRRNGILAADRRVISEIQASAAASVGQVSKIRGALSRSVFSTP